MAFTKKIAGEVRDFIKANPSSFGLGVLTFLMSLAALYLWFSPVGILEKLVKTAIAVVLYLVAKKLQKNVVKIWPGILRIIAIVVLLIPLSFFSNGNKVNQATPTCTPIATAIATVVPTSTPVATVTPATSEELKALKDENSTLKKQIKKIKQSIVPEEYRCKYCGGDIRVEGCIHHNEYAKSNYSNKASVNNKVTKNTQVVAKDTKAPTVKISTSKSKVKVGDETVLTVSIKDNKSLKSVKPLVKNLKGISKAKYVKIKITKTKKTYVAKITYKFTKKDNYKIYLPAGIAVDKAGNKSAKSNVLKLTAYVPNKAPRTTLAFDKKEVKVGEKFTATVKVNDGHLKLINRPEDYLVGLTNAKFVSRKLIEVTKKTYVAQLTYEATSALTSTGYVKSGLAVDSKNKKSLKSNSVAIKVNNIESIVPIPTSTPTPVPTSNPTSTPIPGSTPTPTPIPTSNPTSTPAPVDESEKPVVTLVTKEDTFKVNDTTTFTARAEARDGMKSFDFTKSNFIGLADAIEVSDIKSQGITDDGKFIIITGKFKFTKVGAYNIQLDKGIAVAKNNTVSAASNVLKIDVETDQASTAEPSFPPIANDITRPVVKLSGGTYTNDDTFTLTVKATDNSGKCKLDPEKTKIKNLPSGLSFVKMVMISDTKAEITLKANEVGSYALTIDSDAAYDDAGNKSIESDEALVYVKSATVDTDQTSNKADTGSTDSQNSDSGSSSNTSTSSDSSNSKPTVEVPTTPSDEPIVWE